MKNNNLKSKVSMFAVLAVTMLLMATPASATGLQGSTIYTGTMQLLADLMLWATIACPVIGGLAAVVFAIRRGMADSQDGREWNKRIVTAIVCGVGGGLITGIISLIASYYASAG